MVGIWVRRVVWTLGTLLVLGALVAGVGALGNGHRAGGGASSSSDDRAAPAAAGEAATSGPTAKDGSTKELGAPTAASGSASGTAAATDPGGLGGLTTPTAIGAKVVKTGTISLEVRRTEWDVAIDRIVSTVGNVGGYVQSSTRSEGRASYELAVPVDTFERTVGELRKVGKVTSTNVSGTDVTDEYVDVEARLRHWRAQEALFMNLMAQARTIPESIAVQQQLSATQLQIEQLQGKQRLLASRTSYSTISVEMGEPGVPVSGGGGPSEPVLAQAWSRAVGASLAVLAGTIVVLGVAVPLAILAVPVLAIWWWIRRRDQRSATATAS